MPTQSYNIHNYQQTLMYIKNNMGDLTYAEMDKILKRHPNIVKDFTNLHDPKAVARRAAFKGLRETVSSVVNAVIDEDYEDACYDLAYSLHANIICDFKSYFGYASESDVLKVILADKGTYNTLLKLNNSMHERDRQERDRKEKQRQAQIAQELQKYMFYTQEYKNIMEEYNRCLMRAKGLGSTV